MIAFGLPAFALFGALLVLVGSSQDALAASLGLDLERSGLLGASMVGGIGVGVIVGGPLVDRLPRRPLFASAAGITALALLSVDSGMSFERALAHVLLAGFGGGVYETVLNTATVQRFGEGSVRMVTILHAAATAGAMSMPLAITALMGTSADWTLAFRITGGGHALLAIASLAVPLGEPVARAAAEATPGFREILSPSLLGLCVAAFAYIGVESALCVFAVPYAEGALGLEPSRGRSAISFFWLGLLGGRLLFATGVAARGGSKRAGIAGFSGAAASLVVAAGALLSWSWVEVFTASIGVLLSFIFPLLVALAGQRCARAPGTAVAVVAGIGSLGGFAAPWMVGAIGDAVSMNVAFASLSIWCAAIALGTLLADRGRSA